MMGSALHSAVSRRQVILHHLSDLRYEDTVQNRQHDMLVRYQSYLGSLPAERRPDIVVITGDLTTTGKARDLRAVATTLRICFSTWAGHLHERVFIVPGPRDVSWEDRASIGLQTFYDIFCDFALPCHTPMPSGQGAPTSSQHNFIAYPIDTCYLPGELHASLTTDLTRYAMFYRRFARRRDQLTARRMGMWTRPWRPRRREREQARAEQLASLRKQFLDVTEGGQLLDLRAGRISRPDLERFERWVQPTIQNASQAVGVGGGTPLKILISHHPFDILAGHDTSSDGTPLPQHCFKRALTTACAAGFHLILHGQVHEPQLLRDTVLFEGPDHLQPIRQIGAASLDKAGVFNEICALAHDENGGTTWRIDLRLVNLNANGAADLEVLSLRNPAETSDKLIKQLTQRVKQRREFERTMRFAMRRFSEQVFRVQGANRQDWSNVAPLPQDAMHLIQDVVRDVIFAGYETRVRLLLKSTEDHTTIPKLIPTYLAPAVMEGPDALVYSASVAAWALILGRTLSYPAIKSQGTDEEDHEWLRRTAKLEPLLSTLKVLMQEAAAKSYPGRDALDRYQILHTKLEAIKVATPGAGRAAIAGEHMYQPAPSGSPPASYPYFICVPYPMRPIGGAPPALPETMVLDVGVRQAEQLDGQRVAQDPDSASPFIPERIEMLETLAEVIGMILITASALGRPHGVWDARFSR